MLQIIKAVFKEENDIQLALVFANQTEEDILCRADLEKVLKDHPNQFKLWYTLDRPPQGRLSVLRITMRALHLQLSLIENFRLEVQQRLHQRHDAKGRLPPTIQRHDHSDVRTASNDQLRL